VGGTVVTCGSCEKKVRVRAGAPGVPKCPGCGLYLPWIVAADESSFAAETGIGVPVLVDFWAEWCGPCHAVAPVLERLAARQAGKLKIVKVDVDASPGLAARFGAASIPLLVLLRNGEEVQRVVGAQPLPALETFIVPHLAMT
jgi:thioredoxin 2